MKYIISSVLIAFVVANNCLPTSGAEIFSPESRQIPIPMALSRFVQAVERYYNQIRTSELFGRILAQVRRILQLRDVTVEKRLDLLNNLVEPAEYPIRFPAVWK